jgi:type IV pilus assembly protein PilW
MKSWRVGVHKCSLGQAEGGVSEHARVQLRGRHTLAGFALPEVLISMGLTLPVVLSAIVLLIVTTEQQALCAQQLIMEQDAQFALEVIARTIEQAGHRDMLDSETWPPSGSAVATAPPVTGWDNASMTATSNPLNGPVVAGLMGSDVLIAHFAGTGLLNCAGLALPAQSNGAADVGYSVFYVARGAANEPELRCKYPSTTSWVSEPLIAGVETLQFLFGVDRDADGLPDQYMNASAIRAEQGRSSAGKSSLWESVVAVKISLLMRSARTITSPSAEVMHLFGARYSQLQGGQDKGTQLSVADFPVEQRLRLRRIFEQVVFLRNPTLPVQPALIQPASAMKSSDIAAAGS